MVRIRRTRRSGCRELNRFVRPKPMESDPLCRRFEDVVSDGDDREEWLRTTVASPPVIFEGVRQKQCFRCREFADTLLTPERRWHLDSGEFGDDDVVEAPNALGIGLVGIELDERRAAL